MSSSGAAEENLISTFTFIKALYYKHRSKYPIEVTRNFKISPTFTCTLLIVIKMFQSDLSTVSRAEGVLPAHLPSHPRPGALSTEKNGKKWPLSVVSGAARPYPPSWRSPAYPKWHRAGQTLFSRSEAPSPACREMPWRGAAFPRPAPALPGSAHRPGGGAGRAGAGTGGCRSAALPLPALPAIRVVVPQRIRLETFTSPIYFFFPHPSG